MSRVLAAKKKNDVMLGTDLFRKRKEEGIEEKGGRWGEGRLEDEDEMSDTPPHH
jgi:hypothetical protein